MSGGFFGGGFTQGSGTYSTGTYPTATGFPPYGIPGTTTGYATAFQGGNTQRQDQTVQAPQGFGFPYGPRPDMSGYGATAPIYASPPVVSGGGVAAAPMMATMPKPAVGGGTISNSTKPSLITPTSAAAAGTSTYTGYDAAVYAAATSYLQSKAVGSNWLGMKKAGGGQPMGAGNYTGYSGSTNPTGGGGGGRGSFPRKGAPSQPRAQQLHYCEVCKISCAGPQTYREHLEGQKHKKKEAQTQGETQPLAKNKTTFRCDLCSVTCTGQDTYQAHVRGAKHQKTLKLHQTLGKPIPSTEPTVIPPAGMQKAAVKDSAAGGTKKIVGVQKVAFVPGQKLACTGPSADGNSGNGMEGQEESQEDTNAYVGLEKEVQPVGEDYIEPVKGEDGKVTQYHCKLCECQFNDLNAKDMHLKGRRHRLQFKKKVNPDLEVDMKVPPKMRRGNDGKMRKDMNRMRHQEMWNTRGGYQNPMMPAQFMDASGPVPLFGPNRQPPYGAGSLEDRYVMAKHAAIYPTEEEKRAITSGVTNVEKALKAVSDCLEDEKNTQDDHKPSFDDAAPKGQEERLLKGTMRLGALANSLSLRGDGNVDLVVLCSEKPTKTLVAKVADLMPPRLSVVSEETYEVAVNPDGEGIKVSSNVVPKVVVSIAFTSILMRDPVGGEAANKPDPTDVLDKQRCLEALAGLRHAKWFQATCSNLDSCSILLRIFTDFRQRCPTWEPLMPWALELLIQKVLGSAGYPSGPADAFRRVFEAVATGIFLPGGAGLLDPCEKDPVDAAVNMTPQQREDITASAQHALRLIAFKRIYEVLGIERTAVVVNPTVRKRPLETVEEPEDVTNGKKDKKEDNEMEVDKPESG